MPGPKNLPPLPEKMCDCGCKELFLPKRSWQRFKDMDHHNVYWNKVYAAAEQIVLADKEK